MTAPSLTSSGPGNGPRAGPEGRDSDTSAAPGPAPSPTRLLAHYLALSAVLLGLWALAGTNAVWSADEGALLYQLSADESLGGGPGSGTSFGHPFPEADPDGTRHPLHLSSWAADQPADPDDPSCPMAGKSCEYVSLGKHRGFLWLAGVLFRAGGYRAVMALSIVGTLAAAVATSRLAGRIDRRAELPALWLAGVGSPLLMNGYVAWAHTPTAALVGCAVLLLSGQGPTAEAGPGRRPADLARVAFGLAALFVACLLRTEATLAGLAIGAGWVGLAATRSDAPIQRVRTAARGGAAVLATAAGTLVDRLTATPTLGPIQPPSFDEAFGLIDGRIEGLANTWLRPGYVMVPADLLLLAAATAMIGGALMIRRGASGPAMARPILVLAVACVAARFLWLPVALVPGLAVAFPVLFVGIILTDRPMLRLWSVQLVLAPFVLFCAAVLATQYRFGGGGEWGGRYFALGLPLGIAVATAALIRAGERFPANDRRLLGALLATSILLVNLMGLLGLGLIRDRTADLATAVATTATEAGDGDPRPVVVTTMNGLGRWLWEDLDRYRMLRVSADELPEVAGTLDRLGVERMIIVSLHADDDAAAMAGHYQPDGLVLRGAGGTVIGLTTG